MVPFLIKLLSLEIDKERGSIACIAAGGVYLVAFNTVLSRVDIWYFSFIVLVAAIFLPFVLTEPAALVERANPTQERAAALYDPATDREQALTVCVAVQSDEDREGEA